MNTQATLQKLNELRLPGMARAYRTLLDSGQGGDMTNDEVLAHLVDTESEDRENRKLSRLLKNAKLRYNVFLEQVDFRAERCLDKQEFLRLCECEFVKQNRNVCLSGKTGTGKSYLACVLGHHACALQFKVSYFNCLKFFPMLAKAKADGSYGKILKNLEKTNLLILDDFGLEPLSQISRLALLEILDDKIGNGAVVIASQIPVEKWHNVIGEPTIADSICDRLLQKSFKIHLQGDSMR